MNIESFIRSEEIAEMIKEEWEKNTPTDLVLRYAWIVWQSSKSTIKEKWEAWDKIINTMPNVSVPLKQGDYEGGLHRLLQQYMKNERVLVDAMEQGGENVVYLYDVLYEEDAKASYEDSPPFKTFEECMEQIKLIYEYNPGQVQIDVKVLWYEPDKRSIYAQFKPGTYELMKISGAGFYEDRDAKIAFKKMRFDFHTPFSKGDILIGKSGQPFVLDSIGAWSNEKRDMHYHGYFVGEDGSVFHKQVSNGTYMDLDYYREPLTSHRRILKIISEYLKGELSLEELLRAHYVMRLEESIMLDKLIVDLQYRRKI